VGEWETGQQQGRGEGCERPVRDVECVMIGRRGVWKRVWVMGAEGVVHGIYTGERRGRKQ
jgi:hypothetical protein